MSVSGRVSSTLVHLSLKILNMQQCHPSLWEQSSNGSCGSSLSQPINPLLMRRWWANLGVLNQNSQTRQQNLGPNDVGFHKNWAFWSPYLLAGVAFARFFAYRGGNSSRLVGRTKGFNESYGSTLASVEPQLLKNILIIFYVVIEPTHLKDMLVKMGIFHRDEHKNYLSCHQLDIWFILPKSENWESSIIFPRPRHQVQFEVILKLLMAILGNNEKWIRWITYSYPPGN